jgi:hypothetical protein
LPDPWREPENKLHALTNILTLATCAVIGGAESWDGIAVFGRAKEPIFRHFLKLANGTPSPGTLERVVAKLGPVAFAAAFGRWLAAACEATGLVPIARRGRLSVGHRPADPRPGRGSRAGGEGQPAGPARGRRAGVRRGVRGRVRGDGRRRPRVGGGGPRAAGGAVRDGDRRPPGAAGGLAGRGSGGAGEPGAGGRRAAAGRRPSRPA